MVNSAGIATEASNPQPIYETPEEALDSTWQVNVRGSFLGCKYAGKQMMKQQKRDGDSMAESIINLASVLAVKGLSGTVAYAASKGAVLSLTRTTAMDYARHQIHCNAILPGCKRPFQCVMNFQTDIHSSHTNSHDIVDDRRPGV